MLKSFQKTDTYFVRKEAAVLADLKTAFDGYQRLIAQVNSIRTWTVTFMSASLVLMLSNRSIHPLTIGLVVFIALIAFLVLELRERSSMAFNKSEVIKIEHILMLTGQQDYMTRIKEYEFRDLRLARIERRHKIGHLVNSLQSWAVIVWYGCWICLLILATAIDLSATK